MEDINIGELIYRKRVEWKASEQNSEEEKLRLYIESTKDKICARCDELHWFSVSESLRSDSSYRKQRKTWFGNYTEWESR